MAGATAGEHGDECHATRIVAWYGVPMRIRQLNHSVYQIQYHVVWGTKYRRKVLTPYVHSELIKNFYTTQRRYPDWYFHRINTAADHVHMLIEIPPKYAVADVVRELKACSAAHLKKRFPFLTKVYKRGAVWGAGYFVSTVGLNEENIKKYIERQNQHERGYDVSAEFS